MELTHRYSVSVEWQGNRGAGTSDYKSYGRENLVTAKGKAPIEGSADRAFRGNPERWNPEELMLAALSQCHMLSYLHVAASNGIVVTDYVDAASGVMAQTHDGGGHFTSATLRPTVTISVSAAESADDLVALAQSLHAEASRKCFIAASVNFPVGHEPTTLVELVSPESGRLGS